jgi:sec-independent protein translocase protein TatA
MSIAERPREGDSGIGGPGALKEVRNMVGTTEILIIAAVVLVIFGGSAIPKFARSLGKARKEFEEGVKEGAQNASREKKLEEESKKE